MASPASAGHGGATTQSLIMEARHRGLRVLRFLIERRQAIIVVGLTFAFMKLAKRFEFFERLSDFSRDHENWELDEFFSALMVSSFVMLILAILRARQLRREITARRFAEAHANSLARHDPLTGLVNRRVLSEHLALARHNRRSGDQVELAVLVVDLDRFKPVNDVHGHAAGDMVLTEVASRVGQLLATSPNSLLARLGGDEFACVIEHPVGGDAPIRLAKQIVERLAEPIAIESNAVTIGASVGIAVCADGHVDSDELLRAADIAMYRAKREGRSTFRSYEPGMQAELSRRAALEREMREAIANGEIVPHYQPITQLPDGGLVGFEALARWNHPVHGLLAPDLFIPIAEDAGLIDDLTIVLLRQACVDARGWPPEMTISINLSPIQLKNRWLAAKLLQIVTEGGLAPARLTVEITESGLVSDFDAAQEIIRSLKSAGVQVALDDFGTGFSTLSHLRELNIDRIKIDRSFIRDIDEPNTARMIRAIIGLGVNLGVAVTAEGIETQAGMDLLAQYGCELGQGFLTGSPMTAGKLASNFFPADNTAAQSPAQADRSAA